MKSYDGTIKLDSGIVDLNNSTANMYGCLPCPQCASKYRWPTQSVHPTKPNMILCDDCGFEEPIKSLDIPF